MILSYFKIQKGFIVYPFPCNLLHEIFFFWATTELLCKKGVHYFQPTGIIMQPYNTTAVLCLVWIGNISRQVFFCFVLLRHSTHPWFPLNILLRSSSERISTTMLVEFTPFFCVCSFPKFHPRQHSSPPRTLPPHRSHHRYTILAGSLGSPGEIEWFWAKPCAIQRVSQWNFMTVFTNCCCWARGI